MLDLAGYIPGSGLADKVIIEPACGCGAFMTAIAQRLAAEVSGSGSWERLAGAVAAYDIDANSLELCKSAVIQTLVSNGCPPDTAQELVRLWLHHEDFLLADVPAADFVAGNPPYIRAGEIERPLREAYCKALCCMTKGCDLYVGFFEKALNILRPGGRLCFICADRWLQNAYGRRLRQLVSSAYCLEALLRMHGVDVFEEQVDAYPAITLIRKAPAAGALRFVSCRPEFGAADVKAVSSWLARPAAELTAAHFEAFEIPRPAGDDVYPLGSAKAVDFVTRARQKLPSLQDAGIKLGIGIATGCDTVFLTADENLVEPSHLLPIFYPRDHRRGCTGCRRWLVNPWDQNGQLADLDANPRLKAYFEAHKDALQKRHIAQKNPAAWYRTIDKLIPGLIDRDLLLMPDLAAEPDPILSHGLYPHHNCYWLASDNWDLKVLGGFLLADTTRRFIEMLGVKMRGGTLRFQAQYLRLIHLPPFEDLKAEIRRGLRRAFVEKDRTAATGFAQLAYEDALR